jgi:hypothetical protein
MIVLREKLYSNNFLERITENLDRSGIDDYEVSDSIPGDYISITADPINTKIYVPIELEYSQYDIEDFLRSVAPFIRTRTIFDRNVFILSLSGKLTDAQYIKVVKFIIENEEFCVIIDEQ